jgi:hypothetical protein
MASGARASETAAIRRHSYIPRSRRSRSSEVGRGGGAPVRAGPVRCRRARWRLVSRVRGGA